MKPAAAIWIFLLLRLPVSVYSREDSLQQRLGVMGTIPVLLESANTIYDWHGDTVFEMAPGRLRISLLSRGNNFYVGQLLQTPDQRPLPQDQVRNCTLVYIVTNTRRETSRGVLDPYVDGGQQGIELVLQLGDTLRLAWKQKNRDTLHNYLRFATIAKVPEITGYRFHHFYDSSLDRGYLEKRILQRFNDQTGFDQLHERHLRIPPGSVPEFRIKGYKLLPGEVIEYRLTDEEETTVIDWQKTDHTLGLPRLTGDKTYRLELRFPGQQITSHYTLITGLYWFEQTWVRITGIVLMLALAILFTAWFYRRRLAREKDTRTRVEEQLRTLQSRLSPHFIFNALSSIEGLVSSGQNKQANHYLTLFSGILRQTLEHSGQLTISLSEDLALLDGYLRIEQLRFGFSYIISVDPSIESATLEVPPMLMQPLVENAVKHGVSNKGAEGEIKLTIRADHPDLVVTIYDNGTGRSAIPAAGTAGGHGLRFTRERLAQYARLHPLQSIIFSINYQDQGTTVTLLYRNLLL